MAVAVPIFATCCTLGASAFGFLRAVRVGADRCGVEGFVLGQGPGVFGSHWEQPVQGVGGDHGGFVDGVECLEELVAGAADFVAGDGVGGGELGDWAWVTAVVGGPAVWGDAGVRIAAGAFEGGVDVCDDPGEVGVVDGEVAESGGGAVGHRLSLLILWISGLAVVAVLAVLSRA